MIHCQWKTGYLDIVPEIFFPCSLPLLRKLKKRAIDIVYPYSQREEVIIQIENHLKDRITNHDPKLTQLQRLLKEVQSWREKDNSSFPEMKVFIFDYEVFAHDWFFVAI